MHTEYVRWECVHLIPHTPLTDRSSLQMSAVLSGTGSCLQTMSLLQTYLMEFELEAEDVAQGLVLTHVRLDQRDKELVLVGTALIHF